MADKELAAKLAKRLAFTGEESEQKPEGSSPPPVPEMPKKVVENPYVASDPSFSVDELILKALEVQEENNNYQTSLNSPPSSQTSPASPSKSPLPPKQTIRDWILKDQPQPVNAVPKNPIVPVEHHKPGVLKKAPSPEEDGSELERKLAAQRAKKSADEVVKEDGKPLSTVIHPNPAALAVPVVSTDPVINAGPVAPVVSLESRSEPVKETESGSAPPLGTIVDTTPLVPAVPVADKVEAEPAANLIGDICRDSTPEKPEGKEEPSSSTIEARKTSFEELEEQMQKEVEEEERRKAEEEKKAPAKPPRSLDETVVSSPTAQKKQFVPSPLLMEAIRQECGLKSPPPPTAPKPQTPTNSRPQSPVVTKKSFVSPLGLLCDPLMSIEAPSSPKPQSPKPVKKAPEENPEELEKLLERQRKINDGDVAPQFVNRKMSIYTEFSELTRKQIKSLTETFKKYDEDGDGFIDFMELKRMMEKLGEAQTHIALKEIIKKVDEDQDGKINLREFFLLFRLAAKGELGCSEVFNQLAESIDVSKEGVLAAASFFQAKIAEQTKLSKFEEEIKQEQDEKKREEEEKRARREKFQQSRNLFH